MPSTQSPFREALERDSFAIVHDVVGADALAHLASLAEPLLAASNWSRPGVRDVFAKAPALLEAVRSCPLAGLIRDVVGKEAVVVRSLLFDKSPSANWAVPWHQDVVIALRERIETPGFGPWSIKDGQHHCRPPLDMIQSIVVVRLHLDDCLAEHGPLCVVRGSSNQGILSQEDLSAMTTAPTLGTHCVPCTTARGGCVLMKPLTVHSSSRATNPADRRRVLHLECTNATLPNGLTWAEGHRIS